MKIGSISLPNVKPRYAWLLPLISVVFWWAMLIAMLAIWFSWGRPILDTYHYYMTQYIVYLSNVGATHIQPIFIVGSGGMGIFFVWAVIEDYYLRTKEKCYLPPTFHWFTTGLHALAIAMSIIASLCILMVSCLKDNWQYSRPHSVFVVLFVIFVFVYLCVQSLLFIIYYRKYQIRYFLVSAILKAIWVAIAIVFVVCYGAFMGKGNNGGNRSIWWGYSAIMEWTLVFFYGTMFFNIAWDLRQKSYGNPAAWMDTAQLSKEEPESEQHDLEWDPIDEYAHSFQSPPPPPLPSAYTAATSNTDQMYTTTAEQTHDSVYLNPQHRAHHQSREIL